MIICEENNINHKKFIYKRMKKKQCQEKNSKVIPKEKFARNVFISMYKK